MNAYLLLANGMVFAGQSVGAEGVTVGEVVFATGMVGFEETLTDPSYYGQIITQTYPLIGNYGMNSEDKESGKIWAKGYIVREACTTPSNFRSEETLDTFLKENGIIGIEGIDTRSLTRILRESGVMNGAITTEFDPETEPEKLAALMPIIKAYAVTGAVDAVTCTEPQCFAPTAGVAEGLYSSMAGRKEASALPVGAASLCTAFLTACAPVEPWRTSQAMPTYSKASTARQPRQNRENPTGFPMRSFLLLCLICFIQSPKARKGYFLLSTLILAWESPPVENFKKG